MAINLHWIGTAISSGVSHNGFGAIVSFPTEGGGFPAYGTYNSTLTGVDYLAGVTLVVNSVTYYGQTADYIVKNDGAGGTYTDYATASNIAYSTSTFVTTNNEAHDGGFVNLNPVQLNVATANFAGYEYTWDGAGGYIRLDANLNTVFSTIGVNEYVYNSTGTYLVNIFGSDYPNGKYTYYVATSVGSFASYDGNGSFYSNGTPTGAYEPSFGNPVYWDGNGGYYY